MDIRLPQYKGPVSGDIVITGSKSESNRLLILQALFPQIAIKNLSDSDDTQILQKALLSGDETVDVHHAGTAMRFLAAYFASKEGKQVVLTGSERMQQRPVKLLVEALRDLGADIEYLQEVGYPPLAIKGKKLDKRKVCLEAHVSSQYISALMLIAPSLPHGLEIELKGKVTSTPYILMTLALLKNAGFTGSFEDKTIRVEPLRKVDPVVLTVESDWSSASYFYSIAALAGEAQISLSSLREESHQGDRVIADIYSQFGVRTVFSDNTITLTKSMVKKPRSVCLDLADSPDLAQTIAVTCLGLGINFELKGLHTLRIKETDRLLALENEIRKLGGRVETTSDSIRGSSTEKLKENIRIETYHDHRMAMAFAPLALRTSLIITDAGVVSKSYPTFWEDMKRIGFRTEAFSQ